MPKAANKTHLPNKVKQPPLRPIVELVDVEVDLVVVLVDEVGLPYDLHDVREEPLGERVDLLAERLLVLERQRLE